VVKAALEYWATLRRRLLPAIIVAAIAGGAAYLYLQSLPRTYTSVATIITDDATAQKAAAYMKSIAVATEVARRFPEQSVAFRWVTTSGEPRRTASLFNFRVTERTPERAQAAGNVLLDAWLELTKPRPEYKNLLLQDLERSKSEMKLASDLIQQIQSEVPRQASHPMLDPAATLPALLTRRDTLNQTIRRIERELRGIDSDVILTKPNLPRVADPARSELIAVSAAIFVLMAACIVVVLAHAIGRLSGTTPS
jgi:hypothetical protein